MPKRRARTRLAVEERRTELLAAGRRLFAEHALNELSIGEIADAAGVSKGLLYHYFPGKRDFFVAVVRDVVADLDGLTAPDPALDPLTQLDQGLERFIDFVAENRRLYAAVVQRGLGADAELDAVVEAYRERVMTWVLRSMEIEEPRAAVRIALRGWTGFIDGATLAWVAQKELPRVDLRRFIVAALRAALATARRVDPESGVPAADG